MYQKTSSQDPLQEMGIAFSAAANALTSNTFTAPTARGNILGVSVFLGNNTLADVDNSTITIQSNGVNYYQDVPLIKFAASYQNDNNEFPFSAVEGSQVTVVVNNTSGNAIVVGVNFLFRPPYSK